MKIKLLNCLFLFCLVGHFQKFPSQCAIYFPPLSPLHTSSFSRVYYSFLIHWWPHNPTCIMLSPSYFFILYSIFVTLSYIASNSPSPLFCQEILLLCCWNFDLNFVFVPLGGTLSQPLLIILNMIHQVRSTYFFVSFSEG